MTSKVGADSLNGFEHLSRPELEAEIRRLRAIVSEVATVGELVELGGPPDGGSCSAVLMLPISEARSLELYARYELRRVPGVRP